MAMNSSSASSALTFVVGVLMILYAIVYRGNGANDWSGATIMMFIAIMGMCLQLSINTRHNTSA